MTAVAILLSIVIAFAMGAAGAAKLVGQPAVLRNLDRLNVAGQSSTIGGAEVTLAATMVVGLVSDTFRKVGALGVVTLMAGALVVHYRAGDDPDEYGPAAIIFVLALIVALVT